MKSCSRLMACALLVTLRKQPRRGECCSKRLVRAVLDSFTKQPRIVLETKVAQISTLVERPCRKVMLHLGNHVPSRLAVEVR